MGMVPISICTLDKLNKCYEIHAAKNAETPGIASFTAGFMVYLNHGKTNDFKG